MDYLDKSLVCLVITTFSCCITTGLVLTFATSGGIAAGAIPFTIGACIVMCVIALSCFYKCADYLKMTV